jgi:NAD(P)-dependent dehydrogenase (short-subunit alcohol dehydrogenase family)
MSTAVAIVTGASSGIGKATAVRLARDFGAITLRPAAERRWLRSPLAIPLDVRSPWPILFEVRRHHCGCGDRRPAWYLDGELVAGAAAGVCLNSIHHAFNGGSTGYPLVA